MRAENRKRDAILRRLDVVAFRRHLIENGIGSALAATDEVLIAAMHKARYEIPSMPADLRRESAKWLHDHKMGSLYGVPFQNDPI